PRCRAGARRRFALLILVGDPSLVKRGIILDSSVSPARSPRRNKNMFTQHRCSVSLAFLVALVFAAPAPAAGWPVERGPSREPVPYRYQPEQWKTVPADFLDDAAACTLYSGLTYLVEEDGTIETITHEVTRLNSRKALDKLGEYRSISYNPA